MLAIIQTDSETITAMAKDCNRILLFLQLFSLVMQLVKISNNLQFFALATVYGHLATVYYLLQKRAPTVNQIVQNGCLQFISFLGHYFTPGGGHNFVSSLEYTQMAYR